MIRSPEMDDVTGPQGRLTVSVLVNLSETTPQGLLTYSPALHQREESVAQPITGWRRDRESSVDTGDPGSAETPITLLDVQE